MFSIDNAYVIDPEGFLYICPDMVGNPEFRVGSI